VFVSAAFPSRLGHAFRALRHPQFRLFWIGQGVSVMGTWMQTMAQGWLVYRLTSSPLMLGLLTAARFGPALFAAPIAGVLTDRYERRRVVLATQAASLVHATLLAALTLSGVVQVWHVLAIAFLQGVVDTLDMPARQTLQVELVGIEDLQSAVSLNSSVFNVGRMTGPALAGVIVAAAGEGYCFAFNALSYLAVLLALSRIRPTTVPPASRRSVRDELLEGVRYAWRQREVRTILIGIAITSGIGLSYSTLLPVFARDVLAAGPRGYGLLLGGAGVGAVVGAMAVAVRRGPRGATLIVGLGQGCLGLGLIALGLTRNLWVATAWMTALGLAVSVQLSTTNGFLQVTAPAALRGRVVSLYTWLFAGLSPVGGLGAGWVAEYLGAPWTAVAAGVLCLLAALVMLLAAPRWSRSAAIDVP
jgi:MFS family permease